MVNNSYLFTVYTLHSNCIYCVCVHVCICVCMCLKVIRKGEKRPTSTRPEFTLFSCVHTCSVTLLSSGSLNSGTSHTQYGQLTLTHQVQPDNPYTSSVLLTLTHTWCIQITLIHPVRPVNSRYSPGILAHPVQAVNPHTSGVAG